ncbi:RNA-directed DNA polymerase, eukaryota [Tanacetum coccineum]
MGAGCRWWGGEGEVGRGGVGWVWGQGCVGGGVWEGWVGDGYVGGEGRGRCGMWWGDGGEEEVVGGDAGLEEIPLGGSSFTWCHKSATKMSKLDRFLISENLFNSYPDICATSLDRFLSDHRPILLRESNHDYGPIPFRYFNHWTELDGFNKFVIDTWNSAPVETNAMRNVMQKFKFLKGKIREWLKIYKSKNGGSGILKEELNRIDADIDKGLASDIIINRRMEVIKSIQYLDKIHVMDLAQKAKVKWAIEGDENSRYFHGVLNKKRSQSNIRGIMVDGKWQDNPKVIKSEFFLHFRKRFEKPSANRILIDMNFPKTISIDQQTELEGAVSKEEVKKAVWDCGSDKSPGPDGFSFGFYRKFWTCIENDVFAAVNYFFTFGDIPKGCNACFIALIPKVHDANLVKDFRPISLIGSIYKIIAKILANRLVGVLGDIVNESKKKQSLIFKVDFEKAYDSVRWDFLDDVLKKFGFGNKWCDWIQKCLRSSRGSIIINGSPTEEFQFFKGLKQGDPLSPFLFILIMESLHLSFQSVVDVGLFKGIHLSPLVNLSHMFYADDAVFVGQWCDDNINTLVHVLECFFRASGLRINMSKSKIMGVNVGDDKIKVAASKLGCLILNTPFTYLGTKVGGNMSRVQAWTEIIDKVKSRLSNWKLKSLSIGGRLTLLKSVLGSIPIFHMSIFKVPLTVLRSLESIRCQFFNGHELKSNKSSWVKWNSVLAAKEKGGLGVSSLFALNRALLMKWFWRFYSHNDSLWSRVIKAIYGVDGERDRGKFSVASIRRFIDDQRLLTVDSKTLWIKSVPIKVNILAWKIKLEALPTRFNISRRVSIFVILDSAKEYGVSNFSKLFVAPKLPIIKLVRRYEMWEMKDHAVLSVPRGLCFMGGDRIWEFMGTLIHITAPESARSPSLINGSSNMNIAPEGFDLMLWGDLHTLFEPDENDEIWKDQHEYNLLSWRLHDFCGIHILLMNNGLAIHMLTEKKYPLSQEMLSKMLSTRLEVDHESSQAFELLRFIRAQGRIVGNKSSYDLILPTVLNGLVLLAQVKADDMKIRRIDQGVGSTSGIRACALRYFDLGNMELENSQNNSLAKLPILKLGEYEMWEIRIKQYFQIQDYALWEVIEYGNSWVPIPITAPESGPSTALKMTVPSTTEEKICKKNDVKARSLLLMALPNEHQLTFNQYADAQSMFIAIKARFGGNDATKKTQKALLKQQYENFNATSSESLDSIFNRLQKLVSRLAILGVDTSPEDLNVKFLRSLPSEWDTHVVVWMNKPDFETMGLDDLYNNFKIVEQKVKRTVAVNNDDKNLAFLTTTSPSSTNSINTANTGVSTGNSKVNTASAETSTASFSDATAYAFLSSQPQGSQLVHEDLEQIHDDDLEEMDLKWNMALLSMRARKFYQRTGRKIVIDGSSTAGYDKSKVECFNCHKMGHFARECRVPRSKDNRNWNQGNSSKAVRIEDASEKAMCAIDGGGFDWSDMAEDEVQANMALMAFTDSEVSNDKSCSKSCLLNYEALKKQYDDLLIKLDDTAFKAATYKRGLSILEAQVVKYKESEVLFSEEIALLKRSVGHKDYLMGLVKTELEKVKEEKEGFEFKLAKFEKSSKDLDALLASQVTDKSKRGFGYTAVPSPHPLILNRPTPLDLSYSGLEEFQHPEVNGYGPRDSSLKPTNVCDRESNNSKENTDDSLTQQPKTGTETRSVVTPLKVDKEWKEKLFHPANNVRLEEPKKARENPDAPIIEDWGFLANMWRYHQGFFQGKKLIYSKYEFRGDLSRTKENIQFCLHKANSSGSRSLNLSIKVGEARRHSWMMIRKFMKKQAELNLHTRSNPKLKLFRTRGQCTGGWRNADLLKEKCREKKKIRVKQRAQIARDAEIARQWEEEEKKKAMDEAKTQRIKGISRSMISRDVEKKGILKSLWKESWCTSGKERMSMNQETRGRKYILEKQQERVKSWNVETEKIGDIVLTGLTCNIKSSEVMEAQRSIDL